MKPLNLAIVGATGLVGRTFLQALSDYQIPVASLRLFASAHTAGTYLSFHQKEYLVENLETSTLESFDYALFSAGATISRQHAQRFLDAGAKVIDNSSAFRMESNVPLVVPEVNGEDAFLGPLIANPNCSTIQSVVPLFALDQAFGVKSVVFSTYQSVAGSGQKGVNDLIVTQQGGTPSFYPYNIAQTAIPQIDEFLDSGYTKEEVKMVNESRKILHRPDLKVSATCIRVPVPLGHGVHMQIELKELPSLDEIRKVLSLQEGLVLKDRVQLKEYPLATEVAGTDEVHVGRLRIDTAHENSILLYCVADNIRKGAAGNAVQILKFLEDKKNK